MSGFKKWTSGGRSKLWELVVLFAMSSLTPLFSCAIEHLAMNQIALGVLIWATISLRDSDGSSENPCHALWRALLSILVPALW